eukprot:Skav233443  [mRNA]  locus=scaffold1486:339543:342293:- [translate_table: standard]
MDRGPAKLNELISRIQLSQYDPSISFEDALSGAKDVDPSRISLPDVAGILDPAVHLKGDRLKEFLEMPSTIPSHKQPLVDNPACHKISDEDWPVLLRKLYAADMITFLKKQDVLAEGRKLIKGGLFCVPHKPESDRLINDRRPLNARENRLDWCQLPAGPLLCQLILTREQSIRASGDDLSNYFYLIKHLESWHHRNCFGRPFKGRLLPELGLDSNQLYMPAFKVVCMGDTNGVDLAQATHEAILESVGCLQSNQTLTYGKVFPCSNTLEGLYIDDHLAFQVVGKKKIRKRGKHRDEHIMEASRAQYAALGLPRSEKKAFDKQYQFKAWGTAVDSKTGSVSAPVEKLRQIESLTVALLDHGVASKKALQKLMGLYIHPFMHRRECMSIFHHAYRYVDNLPEIGTFKLPQSIRDELVTAAVLLPLTGCNIRWPVSVQISATDASLVRGGRAACITSKGFAKSLYRFGEKRGEYTRLDWESQAIPPPSTMHAAPSALVESLMKHTWTASDSKPFKKKEHINLLELEMVKQEIVDRVNSGRGHCRVVNLCDSRVVVGCYAKGRSSSVQMNARMRSCLAWSLVGDISLTNLWVDTHNNPADYPSRNKEIPKPPPAQLPDPLLPEAVLRGSQVSRSIGEQVLLEQEAQRHDSEPVLESSFDAAASRLKTEPGSTHSLDEKGSHPKLKFREIFAGCARLSKAMQKVAFVEVLEPVEIKHASAKLGSQDILDKKFFNKLLLDAKEPGQLWHFGLPCGSFSILQHSNGGTRRRHCPQGLHVLDREIKGNLILKRTLQLIAALTEAGNWWTLENPKSSYVWLMPELLHWIQHHTTNAAVMHQCAYGLRLKGPSGKYGPCKKHTQFIGNLPGLDSLSQHCRCKIEHVHAVGGVKTRTGWKRRSELAGHYPTRLCQRYGEIVSQQLL